MDPRLIPHGSFYQPSYSFPPLEALLSGAAPHTYLSVNPADNTLAWPYVLHNLCNILSVTTYTRPLACRTDIESKLTIINGLHKQSRCMICNQVYHAESAADVVNHLIGNRCQWDVMLKILNNYRDTISFKCKRCGALLGSWTTNKMYKHIRSNVCKGAGRPELYGMFDCEVWGYYRRQ